MLARLGPPVEDAGATLVVSFFASGLTTFSGSGAVMFSGSGSAAGVTSLLGSLSAIVKASVTGSLPGSLVKFAAITAVKSVLTVAINSTATQSS